MQRNRSTRSRVWTYTSFQQYEPLVELGTISYQLHQLEQCPNSGRPHWQGTVRFKHPREPNGVKQYLGDPSAHVEVCGDEQASIEYCRKSDSRLESPRIYGSLPNNKSPNWWQDLSDAELWEQHPTFMLRHYNGVAAYRRATRRVSVERPKPRVWIFFGAPGTGKSTAARALGNNNYYAKPSGNWWDGYTSQSTVIFDDFTGGEQYGDVLRWCSELPIFVPIKNSMVPLAATQFIFTTNLYPTRLWANISDKSAFWRRVTFIIECFLDRFEFIDKNNIGS